MEVATHTFNKHLDDQLNRQGTEGYRPRTAERDGMGYDVAWKLSSLAISVTMLEGNV